MPPGQRSCPRNIYFTPFYDTQINARMIERGIGRNAAVFSFVDEAGLNFRHLRHGLRKELHRIQLGLELLADAVVSPAMIEPLKEIKAAAAAIAVMLEAPPPQIAPASMASK